jgi:hypothetical protein
MKLEKENSRQKSRLANKVFIGSPYFWQKGEVVLSCRISKEMYKELRKVMRKELDPSVSFALKEAIFEYIANHGK